MYVHDTDFIIALEYAVAVASSDHARARDLESRVLAPALARVMLDALAPGHWADPSYETRLRQALSERLSDTLAADTDPGDLP